MYIWKKNKPTIWFIWIYCDEINNIVCFSNSFFFYAHAWNVKIDQFDLMLLWITPGDDFLSAELGKFIVPESVSELFKQFF